MADAPQGRAAALLACVGQTRQTPRGLTDFLPGCNAVAAREVFLRQFEVFFASGPGARADGLTVAPAICQMLPSRDACRCLSRPALPPTAITFRQGIEFDRIGRRRGLSLLSRHPGDGTDSRGSQARVVRLPASEIIPLIDPRFERSQCAGISSAGSPIVKLFLLAVRRCLSWTERKSRAMYAMFVTSPGRPRTHSHRLMD